jgi:hypothetical protein
MQGYPPQQQQYQYRWSNNIDEWKYSIDDHYAHDTHLSHNITHTHYTTMTALRMTMKEKREAIYM